MKYPFCFKVLGYNADDKEYFEECGMGLAASYGKAAEILEKRYGDELVAIKRLELLEEDSVIVMPEKMCAEILTMEIDGNYSDCYKTVNDSEAKCL